MLQLSNKPEDRNNQRDHGRYQDQPANAYAPLGSFCRHGISPSRNDFPHKTGDASGRSYYLATRVSTDRRIFGSSALILWVATYATRCLASRRVSTESGDRP